MATREILPLHERAKVVMRMLRRAADRNDVCPGNSVIATAIGAASPSAGANIIAFLESSGMIAVERGRTERIVTISATGKRTRGTITAPAKYRTRHKIVSFEWTSARDDILMEAVANELDFEQAGHLVGTDPEICAARFDELCAAMGRQAA
ncbi:hypothetical protein GCM10007897_43000 [Sphingobium jiangsuense]|uniref:SOS-response transcriptional repressor LexA n=1 Tax=Sphingobium jiangsuense TaxID=870476 RepID=A0A7W6BVR5_9SPHN|nr:hypothetical protein [Sphingobium jiangsuense]MBB3928779.1 SOS-response transcriptional repressor LexA [Sphingobium jiangsuense]GLT02874.1 hypothetical protein GCM10007897_43000 [Sphingobium jiangsuense]